MRTKMVIALAAILGSPQAASALSPPIPKLPAPSQFVKRITNPWFPLLPGTVYVYRGTKDGKQAIDVLAVTHRQRTIDGIRATVINDRLYENGRLAERTTDWYAQDRSGTVWYLGENTATLNARGNVLDTSGSWMAGVGGAHAGIYMPGHPHVGQLARQEYAKGQAEDQFRILQFGARVDVGGVSSQHALLTQETTALEPGVVDHKLYVRGIGTALEVTVKGGNERLELISMIRP
jgi:hypothetical protein